VARRRAAFALALAATGATMVAPPPPLLVWNVSGSAPRGLYAVLPGRAPDKGAMVVARLPEPVRRLAARRHYLPLGVPVVKRVAASGGDQVCATGSTLFINGKPAGQRLRADRSGRRLPAWHGCVRLLARQVLLLTPATRSFDGRYFGPTDRADLIGTARLIWRA